MTILHVDNQGRIVTAKEKRRDKRSSSTQRGYGSRWQVFSKRYLRAHPWCLVCGARSDLPDHIDGLGPHGPRGYDEANLRPMCRSCHSKRTARDQPGGWAA